MLVDLDVVVLALDKLSALNVDNAQCGWWTEYLTGVGSEADECGILERMYA